MLAPDFVACPALLVGGALLWRREALGYVVAAGLLFLLDVLFASLFLSLVLGALFTASPIDLRQVVLDLGLALICVALLALLFWMAARRLRTASLSMKGASAEGTGAGSKHRDAERAGKIPVVPGSPSNQMRAREEKEGLFMSHPYRATAVTRVRDALFKMLLRAGVNMGATSLLTVRGRSSGQPRLVLVIPVSQGDCHFLVAPYGPVQWVCNLRAAGTATLTHARHSEVVSARELEASEAAPILKPYLLKVAWVRPSFDVTQDASLEAFEREAPHHPVFEITTIGSWQKGENISQSKQGETGDVGEDRN